MDTCYESGITNHESQITNHESRITNYESRITNHESRITNHELRITNYESRITNYECLTSSVSWRSIGSTCAAHHSYRSGLLANRACISGPDQESYNNAT